MKRVETPLDNSGREIRKYTRLVRITSEIHKAARYHEWGKISCEWGLGETIDLANNFRSRAGRRSNCLSLTNRRTTLDKSSYDDRIKLGSEMIRFLLGKYMSLVGNDAASRQICMHQVGASTAKSKANRDRFEHLRRSQSQL